MYVGEGGDGGIPGGQNDKIQDTYQDPYIFLISETRGVQRWRWGDDEGITGYEGVTKRVKVGVGV